MTKKTAAQIDRAHAAERFEISDDRVKLARKAFEAARASVANAKAFGSAAHSADAAAALIERAEIYADALTEHTRHVIAVARTSGPA